MPGDGWKVPWQRMPRLPTGRGTEWRSGCLARSRVSNRTQVDVRERSEMNLGKSKHRRQWRGNRNEGVGEHVRTRFHLGPLGPVKLRSSQGDPHRTKKHLFLLPDRFLKERALSKIRSSRLT